MKGSAAFPVRLQFTKLGRVRFISHRDVARAFERAMRVEALPLAFTKGFVPRPRISFGHALAVGHESVAEYLDVDLDRDVDIDGLPERLSGALPQGIDVTGAAALAEGAPALQESVAAMAYRVVVVSDGDRGAGGIQEALASALTAALAAPSLVTTLQRKGREVEEDLRPMLENLEIAEGPDDPTLAMELSTRPRVVRPGEVLGALGPGFCEQRVVRTAQWIERDARLGPLEADARPCIEEMRGP